MTTRKKFEPNTFRRRYNYVCLKCGAKRTTLNFERMKESVCTVCEPPKVPEGQSSLFGEEEITETITV